AAARKKDRSGAWAIVGNPRSSLGRCRRPHGHSVSSPGGLMDLLVRNGRLVDPARNIDTVTDLVIRAGKIRAIGAANVSGIPQFDATGFIVAPGFFDIHVHLRGP